MAYEELLQLQEQPAQTQLAHFLSCLSPEMRGTLAHALPYPTGEEGPGAPQCAPSASVEYHTEVCDI